MQKTFLAFLALTTFLTMPNAYGADVTPPMNSKQMRENAPALLHNYVGSEATQPIPLEAKAKPEEIEPEAPALKMKPVITKKMPTGRIAKAIFSKNAEGKRLIISFNSKPKLTVQNEAGAVVIRTLAKVNFEPEKVPEEYADSFKAITNQSDGKGNFIINISLPATVKPKISGNKSMVIIEVAGPTPLTDPKTVEVKPEIKAEVAKPVAVKSGTAGFTTENDVQKLKFTFSKPVAAAVFDRFGYYWLVFDTDENMDLPESFKKSPLFASAKKISAVNNQSVVPENFAPPAKNPLIFVLELNKEAYAMATKVDNSWNVDFDPNVAYQQDKPLQLEEKPDVWEIAAKGVTDKIVAKDETTNNLIEIYPLPDAGFIGEEKKNNSFVLGKTVQGITIQPISRIAAKNDEKDKIKIMKPATTTAPEKHDDINVLSNQDAKPIFPFKKWPQLKGEDYRKAELKTKTGDHAEFAKFLFSQQLYPEAAVNLQGVPGFEASF